MTKSQRTQEIKQFMFLGDLQQRTIAALAFRKPYKN